MLEQHQADIQNAHAEIARLEALEQREAILAKMAGYAQRTTKHRKALEKTVHETSRILGQALVHIAETLASIQSERKAFALLGRELTPEFYGRTPFNNGIQDQEKKAVGEAVLRELEARGATLTDVLNTATGKHTRLDHDARPLPNPEHAFLLWQIVSETVAKERRYRGAFHEVHLPVKPQPVRVPVTTSSDDLYQL